MSRLKVHYRIPEQIAGRIYTAMKALCGNNRAKQFDVSAHGDQATCQSCLKVRLQSIKRAKP